MEAPESTPSLGRRVGVLVQFLTVIVVAELLLVFANLAQIALFAIAGLLVEIGLVIALPLVAFYKVPRDPKVASFLGALVLVPLFRIVSLATPREPFSTIQWLAILGVAVLLSAAAVMHAQGLGPRDVFLGVGDRRFVPLNVSLAVFGVLLGYLEFQLLHPTPWITAPGSEPLIPAVIVVFIATGLAEELVFRGILLRTGIRLLGPRAALLYVTLVFTVLHIGLWSPVGLLFVFLTGLLFGIVVLVTKSLWGAALAHAAANVAVYLILPFGTF